MPPIKTNNRKVKKPTVKARGSGGTRGYPPDSPLAYIKTREEYQRYVQAVDAKNAANVTEEDRIACEEAAPEIERIMDAIPPIDRQILDMRAQGCSFVDIARHLRCSPSTVQRRFMKQISTDSKVYRTQ